MAKKEKKKTSIWKKISNVLTTILLVASLLIMCITFVSTKVVSDDDTTYLFGYKPLVVKSDSMKGLFEAGDVIVIKKVDFDSIQVGDVICYHSIDPTNYYEVLTHEVVEVTEYEGNKAYVTKGLANEDKDAYPATDGLVVGAYSFHIAKAGYFFNFLKTPVGYVVCILSPFAILLVIQLANFLKLVKDYRKEMDRQNKVDEASKEKAHQDELDEMRKQIEELKKQLMNNK